MPASAAIKRATARYGVPSNRRISGDESAARRGRSSVRWRVSRVSTERSMRAWRTLAENRRRWLKNVRSPT